MVAIGSFVGTSIEWYDFFLYGTAAALVFSPLFFPDVSPAVGLIASFGTYAVGFLARPVGALVGGHLGDRIGRKIMLVSSLTIMGLSTALIGVLPTYHDVGVLAPILLLVLRLAQGFGVGAEWGGAALMTVEEAPKGRRGLFGSFTQMGVSGGMLLSVGLFALFKSSMAHDSFITWGWRVPFLASALLVIFGLLIRLRLTETTSFIELKAANKVVKNPLASALKDQRRSVLLTTGMRLSQNAVYYLVTTFAIAYIARSVGSESNVGLVGVIVGSAIGLVSTPFWAMISDRVGRRPVYLYGAVTSAIFIGPFFLMAQTGNEVLIIIAMVIAMNFFHDAMYGPQAAFFAELFPAGVRFSGTSLGYQIGSVIGGGFAPLIASALLAANGGRPWLVVAYFLVLSAITIACACLAPETNGPTGLEQAQAGARESRSTAGGLSIPGDLDPA